QHRAQSGDASAQREPPRSPPGDRHRGISAAGPFAGAAGASSRDRDGTTGSGGEEARNVARGSFRRRNRPLAPSGPRTRARSTEKKMNCPIRTISLCKAFGRTQALTGLNLEIPESAIYALVGPNGAGKTTALKVLMNIHRPTAGSSEVLGVDSRRQAPAQFAQIGYVSENQEMPEWMTVTYFLDYLA